MRTRFRTSTVILAAALIALASMAYSTPVAGESGGPLQQIVALLTDPAFGLREIKREIRVIEAEVLSSTHGLSEIKREIRAIEQRARLEVQVAVNEEACASGSVQCGDGATGHTFVAASDANHNPVIIAALVTLNGAPVAGLPASAFDFSNVFVPAGGGAIVLCPAGGTGCASTSLFQDAGDGTYQLWAHRSPSGNWKAGSYFGRLTVTDASGRQGSALVAVVIPAGP